jgi:hypothetical protein
MPERVATMPADERPTFTLTIERDSGEKIEVKQQPIDVFAEHPPFAAPFYCAIGKLVIQQGHVEHQLSLAMSMCRNLEMERPVEVRKGKMTAGQKINVIRDVLENGRLFGEESDDPMWSGILKAAVDIAKKRNAIVHGVVVGFDEGPPPRILLQSADNPDAQLSAYTLQELQDIIPEMQQVHLYLGGLNIVLKMDSVISLKRVKLKPKGK